MRPSRRVGRGCEALLESQEWSGGQGEYGRTHWRDGKGREALQKEAGGVGRPSKRVRRGQEALPESQKWSEGT